MGRKNRRGTLNAKAVHALWLVHLCSHAFTVDVVYARGITNKWMTEVRSVSISVRSDACVRATGAWSS